MDKFLIKKPKICTSNSNNNSEIISADLSPSFIPAEVEGENSNSESSSKDTTINTRTTYKHKFREAWKEQYKWACQDADGNTRCEVCNIVITGSRSHLDRHNSSLHHQKMYKAAVTTPKVTTFLKNDEEPLFEAQVKEAELKLIVFIAEHNLPFRLLDHLPELISSICPDSKIARNFKIKRKKATQLAVAVLAPEIKKEVVSDLKENYFSIIVDETTDVSTTKCLAIVVRYFKKGLVYDRFFDLINVENSTAECIFQTIISALEAQNIPLKNVVGFGADNCSVMMGHLNGVKTLFESINPSIVTIGCTCHSFHLCSSHACEKLPKSIEQLAHDIYNYFAYSSKRLTEFKECQIFIEENPTAMLKPSQTRWLSLQSVVNRILEHP